MHAIADTKGLVSEGLISPQVAKEIETRARALMVKLGINTVLCAGIAAATLGLIIWLADPLAVAVFGTLLLGAGLGVLLRGTELYAIFGNAATLIGAGMLIGGGGIELVSNYAEIAIWVMAPAGAAIAGFSGWLFHRGSERAQFATGAVMLMGVALHLAGFFQGVITNELSGLPVVLLHGYAALAIAAAGCFVNVRFVTALAIAPFAQMLDTGTAYFHAVYVFYSPESTLSILQMASLIGAMVWASSKVPERFGRHALILAILGFVVLNLCALVGSLWGDVVGEALWGPERYSSGLYENYSAYSDARSAFRETALVISAHVYSVFWAVALIAVAAWAAHTMRRGLFNAAVTFGAIHAYTQAFESFYNEPLAYVIGGFAAIPLAWGLWRLNQSFIEKTAGVS